MFEAYRPNSKVYREDLPLFVFVKRDNTRTDLRDMAFPANASLLELTSVVLLILPCIDSWTNEYNE